MTTKVTFPIVTVEDRANFVSTMTGAGKLDNVTRIEGTNWTVGTVKFPDGWSTMGKSVCVNDADYDVEIGKKIIIKDALAQADTHYWRVVGYMAMIGLTEITVPWVEDLNA